jgi:Ig-like domain-containing protein
VTPSSTTSYWVRVTNTCGSANSAAAVITVTNPACTPPSITAQPAGTTITRGSSAVLAVGATGTSPLSYQWYIGSSGDTSNAITGAVSSAITVSPSTTTSYWARVTNSCGAANSAVAVVTVLVTPICNPPVIVVNPSSTSVEQGSTVTLGVVASGSAPLNYQWYVGNSGDTSNPIFGSNGSTIALAPSSSTNVWVRVTNGCGSANSTTATVTVTTSRGPHKRRAVQ